MDYETNWGLEVCGVIFDTFLVIKFARSRKKTGKNRTDVGA